MGRQFEGSKRNFAAPGFAAERNAFYPPSCGIRRIQDSFSRGDDARRGGCVLSRRSGPSESRALSRPAALAYSTESMRLTTRLMQVASWLLLQRAVNEGELTASQAQAERVRVKLSRQEYGCAPEVFDQLPPTLRSLSKRSLRIQERVIHLDQGLVVAHSPEPAMRQSEVASQVERLRAAFSH